MRIFRDKPLQRCHCCHVVIRARVLGARPVQVVKQLQVDSKSMSKPYQTMNEKKGRVKGQGSAGRTMTGSPISKRSAGKFLCKQFSCLPRCLLTVSVITVITGNT